MKSLRKDTAKRQFSSSLLLLAIFSVFLFSCNDKEPVNAKNQNEILKSGDSAPGFELLDINSKSYSLEDFKGQLVVLNFWATWCTPCVLEMPSLQRLYQALKPRGLIVVSINMDAQGKDAEVKKFAESYGLDFPILRDPNFTVADKYGVSGFPETIIINKKGELLSFKDPATKKELVRILSDRPWDSEEYIKELESLIK